MRAVIYIILISVLSSCSAERRMLSIAVKNETAAANVCAKLYPVKESFYVSYDTVTKVVELPGDTIRIDCDSIISTLPTKKKTVYVPVKQTQLIYKTITKDSVRIVENTAQVRALQAQIVKMEQTKQELKRTNNILWWSAGVFLALNILQFFIKR